MWWNLVVFALIGLFVGGAARLFYADRQPRNILASLALGMVGAVLGGLLSWTIWPLVADQIHTAALLLSLFGGVVGLVAWPLVGYFRRSHSEL